MKIHLINRDKAGSVWVEMRFSNADRPYDENTIVPGFPRFIKPNELVEIDPLDYEEVLYRRSLTRFDDKEPLAPHIFRISTTHSDSVKRAYLWDTTSLL